MATARASRSVGAPGAARLALSLALAVAAFGCSRDSGEARPKAPAAAPRTDGPADPPASESPDAEIARLVASFARGQSNVEYQRARLRLAELVPGRAAAFRAATESFESRARSGDASAADVLDNVCDAIQAAAVPEGAALAVGWTSLPHPKLRLKATQTIAGLMPPGATDALAARALDAAETLTVRFAALEGIGLRGDPAVAPRLRPLLDEASSPDLLARVVAALGLLGDAESADRILALATTVDSPVSMEAIRALVRLGDPRGLERLEPLASSTDAHFRLQAASILATAPTVPSMKRLEAMAGDSEAAVRQAVVGGLASAPAGFDANATLEKLAADRDDGVRRGALFTAAKAGAAWALDRLRAAAADRTSPDRLASMVSLGRCRDRASVAPFLRLAEDEAEAPQARLTASNNLARIGDASVLPRLLEIASKVEGSVPNGEPLWRAMAVGLANFGLDAVEASASHYRAANDARGKRVAITVLRFVGGVNARESRAALLSLRETEKDALLLREFDEALGP